MELSDTLHANWSTCRSRPARSDVHLRPDRVRARSRRQRAAVRHRDVVALAQVSGYNVTFVHNITDVNDKIYEAAPARAPSSPSRRRSGTSRTRAARARRARRLPKVRTSP